MTRPTNSESEISLDQVSNGKTYARSLEKQHKKEHWTYLGNVCICLISM